MQKPQKFLIVLALLYSAGIPASPMNTEGELKQVFVERFTAWLCESPEYLDCLCTAKSVCLASIRTAAEDCDTSRLVNSVNENNLNLAKAEGAAYGICIGDGFQSISGVDLNKWDSCEIPDVVPMPNKSFQSIGSDGEGVQTLGINE